MSVHEFTDAGNDICSVCGYMSWSSSAEHEPKIDPDELVTVIYGAGTGNEFAIRRARYMIWNPPATSAFINNKSEEGGGDTW